MTLAQLIVSSTLYIHLLQFQLFGLLHTWQIVITVYRSGDHTHTLISASKRRQELVRLYESIDSIRYLNIVEYQYTIDLVHCMMKASLDPCMVPFTANKF